LGLGRYRSHQQQGGGRRQPGGSKKVLHGERVCEVLVKDL
jgi:hypothetical protein